MGRAATREQRNGMQSEKLRIFIFQLQLLLEENTHIKGIKKSIWGWEKDKSACFSHIYVICFP
ncbi:hypothetical protein D7X87_07810 [bacterium D16-54]|nr:hypothetical protein D7X87_07810 [bacterium D16-54]RKJ15313.1 hypothetical protein D7X65_07835 [bacterium D16-56]